MGLPLFVAPVESDLPSKAADKNGATSPSRSGIRRHVRPDSRERRAAIRRHMSIRDRLANGSLRQSTTSLPGRDGREDAGVRIIEPLHMEDFRRPRPFREVLRDMARTDDRSRERLEEQLHSLFNGNGHPEGEATDNDIDLGWWAGDPIPQSTRTRITAPGPGGEDTLEARIRHEDSWEHRWEPPRREYQRSRQRISPLVQQPTPPRALTEDATNRRQRTTIHDRAPMSELDGGQGRRNAIIQRIRGMDGLGDRDRSLSPEVWDTLLTTLTPDPQPPSAGSSFASTVASQNAGVSSSTSLSVSQSAEAAALDQACESGCENSDTEGADDQADLGRTHQRWDHLRRVRLRVPDYNLDGPLDGPVDGPVDGPFSRGGASNSERSAARQRWLRREAQQPPDIMVGGPGDVIPQASNLSVSHLRGPRHGWVGHLSVGASDDEQVTERRSLNRESSTASGNNTSPGDEEWAGMQRIVRSLARREDIPDEWWAEAGLSRTLPPPDGTD